MAHEHSHHTTTDYNKAFVIGIALNIAYIIIEFVAGIAINSIALIADAGHNLSDVLGLGLAWGANYLAKTNPTQTRTYGMRKSTVLAALFNAIILLIAVGAISIEAIRKFFDPQPVSGTTVMLVAGIGVLINGATAFLFMSGRKKDINIRGAFLHMAADAGISLGVVAAGLVIQLTGWLWPDPVISLVIVIVITAGTWSLLKESFLLSMDAVPQNMDIEEVKKYLLSLAGVMDAHDLHIWAMSTTEIALTVHLVMPEMDMDDLFLQKICRELHDQFGIEHPTIQIEKGSHSATCAPDNI